MIDYINLSILSFLITFFAVILKPFTKKVLPGQKLKCLVYSYLGFNNTGAEVRTLEAIKQIQSVMDNNVSITLYTFNKKNTLRYISEDENLKVIQEYPLFVIRNALLISQHDALILLEGSTFQNNFSTILYLCYLYGIGLAQKLGKLTVAYAVDAGKIKPNFHKFARDIINKMDLIMLRCETSVGALKDIGVTKQLLVTTDTAFNAESESTEWLKHELLDKNIDFNKPLIGIIFTEFFRWPVNIDLLKYLKGVKEDHYYSFCYYSWGENEKRKSLEYKKIIAEYADWCFETYNSNIMLIAMEGNDTKLSNEISELMKNNSIVIDPNIYNSKQITIILRSLKFLVTTRYHGIILSMNNAVPYIGISHDKRIENIMKEMNLYDDYYINYLDVSMLDKLKQKTENLNKNIDELSQQIKFYYHNYQNTMDKNAEYFREAVMLKYKL